MILDPVARRSTGHVPAAVTHDPVPETLDISCYERLACTPMPLALVVEDDEDARDLLTMVLQRYGLDVVGVPDVASALAVLASREVGVVLLDVTLPDGSGFEVCTAVRDHPQTRQVPVVLLTGQDSLDRELEGILCGADAYLVKPVSTSTLLNRLCDLI